MVSADVAHALRARTVRRVALETDEGVCIRCWDWSETSQTVWLYGRRLGLVRCVAKGSKRDKGQFSGGIEALTRGEFIVSLRKVERDPNSLATLASWDLLEVFPISRNNLSAFYAGHAILDIVQHGLADGDPHPSIFEAIVTSARMLDGAAGDACAVLLFAWHVLRETGHTPEVWHDVRGGGDLAAAKTYAFAPRLGGLTRDDIGEGRVGAEAQGDVWRVRAETVETLRDVSRGGIRPGADPASVTRAARLLLMHFREVFSCDPRGVRAWIDRIQSEP